MELRVDDDPSADRDEVAWLSASVPEEGRTVGSWVPTGFARYARILHPATVVVRPDSWGRRPVTWAELAAWSGRSLAPDIDSKDLLVRPDGTPWEDLPGHVRPEEGTWGLGEDAFERLGEHLVGATGTPDRLWLLLDTIEYDLPTETGGYTPDAGDGRRSRRRSARAAERQQWRRRQALEQRYGVVVGRGRFILHRGAFAAARNSRQGRPSYWWPQDRAWLVHTDIDCPTTYLAGSDALIDGLLTDDLLEVVEAHLDHPFDGHG